tara:strand:+ start:82589 stop:83692 length:1104 start_codon:yes stop_codon:yes gene_type:complete
VTLLPDIHLIAGTRPNFIKLAPLMRAFDGQDWCRPVLVHTGQHYDAALSDALFKDLGLPRPDANLGCGSAPHGRQTGAIMRAYEGFCTERRPQAVIVVGDVNSTLACALVAAKLDIRLAHLEAGLRSFDHTMPEEINRIATDVVSDLLWTPSADADANLAREGVPAERIERIGNVMIDALDMMRPDIEATAHWRAFGLARGGYGVTTLHRPSNVDDPARLARAVEALTRVATVLPLVMPLHPRTRAKLEGAGLYARLAEAPGLHLCDALGYVAFQSLLAGARLAITDSGGLQEETTVLGVPCLTVRGNTERPITIDHGGNRLVDLAGLPAAVDDCMAAPPAAPARPALWDGRTAVRAVDSLRRRFFS